MDDATQLKTPPWKRPLWLAAGFASLIVGFVGIFLPLLPTVPFVLLAAFCFSAAASASSFGCSPIPHSAPWSETGDATDRFRCAASSWLPP